LLEVIDDVVIEKLRILERLFHCVTSFAIESEFDIN
jgi:hypothetical protein